MPELILGLMTIATLYVASWLFIEHKRNQLPNWSIGEKDTIRNSTKWRHSKNTCGKCFKEIGWEVETGLCPEHEELVMRALASKIRGVVEAERHKKLAKEHARQAIYRRYQ